MWKEKSLFYISKDTKKETVLSRVYGHCITSVKAYKDSAYDGADLSQAVGVWICVENKGNGHIKITQDNTGGFEIYLYRSPYNDFWAVSNSFWLLCENVSKKYPVTLNDTNAIHYFFCDFAQRAAKSTLANEIEMILPHTTISIAGKKLTMERNIPDLYSVSPNSREGMQIIDGWISKWASRIKALYDQNVLLKFPLSGGFDSRITFALALASGIDLNAENVQIYSMIPKNEGEKRKLADDYERASEIAEHLEFKLNHKPHTLQTSAIPVEGSYGIFEELMSVNHKEPQFKLNTYKTASFSIGGGGGEGVRQHYHTEQNFQLYYTEQSFFNPVAYQEILDTYKLAEPDNKKKNSDEYKRLRDTNFYLLTWQRNHFGIDEVLAGYVNSYQPMPLCDEELYLLDPNLDVPAGVGGDVLFAIILQRICPYLVTAPFSKGEKFAPETVAFAENITRKYPPDIQISEQNLDISELYVKTQFSDDCGKYSDPRQIVKEKFKNQKYQELFVEHFGKWGKQLLDYFGNAYELAEATEWFPQKHLVPFTAVSRVLEYAEISSPYNNTAVYKTMKTGYTKKYLKGDVNKVIKSMEDAKPAPTIIQRGVRKIKKSVKKILPR